MKHIKEHTEKSKYSKRTDEQRAATRKLTSRIFVGVSVANVVSKEMVKTMNEKAILFPLANPVPEISYEDAKEAQSRGSFNGGNDAYNAANFVVHRL